MARAAPVTIRSSFDGGSYDPSNFYKRLERGTFKMPRIALAGAAHIEMEAAEMVTTTTSLDDLRTQLAAMVSEGRGDDSCADRGARPGTDYAIAGLTAGRERGPRVAVLGPRRGRRAVCQ